MTYTPDIPQTGETLGGTRARINTNFQNLDTAFSANHSELTTNTDGKHTLIQLPTVTSTSKTVVTAANEMGLYSDDNTFAGSGNTVPALYYRLQSNGSDVLISGETAPVIQADQGQTFLPGGLIMKWGKTGSVSGTGTVTFTTGGDFVPFSSDAYVIQLTKWHPLSSPGTAQAAWVSSNTVLNTSFSYNLGDSHSWFLNWLAIGPA